MLCDCFAESRLYVVCTSENCQYEAGGKGMCEQAAVGETLARIKQSSHASNEVRLEV